jgi:hypothetical protein
LGRPTCLTKNSKKHVNTESTLSRNKGASVLFPRLFVNVNNSNSSEIDLVHIARTSAAVAGASRLSNGMARRHSQDNRIATTIASNAVCLDYIRFFFY